MNQISLFSTDLDYTFVDPIGGVNREKLNLLKSWFLKNNIKIAYVTGRSFDSVIGLVEENNLPHSDYIISEVGTSIYCREDNVWIKLMDWKEKLSRFWSEDITTKIRFLMCDIENSILQPITGQGEFKLSYFIDDNYSELPKYQKKISNKLKKNSLSINFIISSTEPNHIFVDFLPIVASKSKALEFLIDKLQITKDNVVFCGDSGNDRDALLSGVYGILVKTNDVKLLNDLSGKSKIFISDKPNMEGIIEGLKAFKFMEVMK